MTSKPNDQIELPFGATVDGRRIEKYASTTNGQVLEVRVLSKAEWPERIRPLVEEPITLHLFERPMAGYPDLEQELDKMDGKKVSIGDIPSLVKSGDTSVSTSMQQGNLYEVLVVGNRGYERGFAGRIRLATTSAKVPDLMSLDELKMLALEYLGLAKQATCLEARITPMTAWNDRGRLIIAGFTFGKEHGLDYGLMVDHCGGVSTYHGIAKEKLRQLLRLKP